MKKGIRVLGIMIFSILISISFVSAGFWGDLFSFGDDSDLEGELANVDVTIQMANAPPIIDSWTEPLGFGPTSGTTTTVTFVVTMFDDNGDTDLVDGIVSAEFSMVGETTRSGSCAPQASTGDKYLNFDCSVSMQYYDAGGQWEITITADDGTDSATNSPKASDTLDLPNYPYFNYGTLLDIMIEDSNDPVLPLDTIGWTGISASSIDEQASTNLIIENYGNVDVASLSVLGRDLISATDPVTNTDVIEPDSFSVHPIPVPCNNGQLLNKPVSALTVSSSFISRGAGEILPLFFCIESINPTGSPAQADDYETQSSPNDWELEAYE